MTKAIPMIRFELWPGVTAPHREAFCPLLVGGREPSRVASSHYDRRHRRLVAPVIQL